MAKHTSQGKFLSATFILCFNFQEQSWNKTWNYNAQTLSLYGWCYSNLGRRTTIGCVHASEDD
jgi:hypothetical protein